MALGEPIGFSARLTQNNRPGGLYENEQNNCASLIHIALMGDPTLRMHVVAPPSNVSLTEENNNVTLNWSASSEPGPCLIASIIVPHYPGLTSGQTRFSLFLTRTNISP